MPRPPYWHGRIEIREREMELEPWCDGLGELPSLSYSSSARAPHIARLTAPARARAAAPARLVKWLVNQLHGVTPHVPSADGVTDCHTLKSALRIQRWAVCRVRVNVIHAAG